MKTIVKFILIVLLSCNSKQGTEKVIDKDETIKPLSNETSLADIQNVDTSKTEIIETFVDSLGIGEKGKCKVELIKHRVNDANYVIVKFYIKGRNTIKDPESWMIQNHYSYEINSLMGFEPNISDFNNDNEVRRLFIYDDLKKELNVNCKFTRLSKYAI